MDEVSKLENVEADDEDTSSEHLQTQAELLNELKATQFHEMQLPPSVGKQCESGKLNTPTTIFGFSGREDLKKRYYVSKYTKNVAPLSPGPIYNTVTPLRYVSLSEMRNSPGTVFPSAGRPSILKVVVRARDGALVHKLGEESNPDATANSTSPPLEVVSPHHRRGVPFGRTKRQGFSEIIEANCSPGPKYLSSYGGVGSGRTTYMRGSTSERSLPIALPHASQAARTRKVAAKLEGRSFTSIGKQVVSRSKSSSSFGFGRSSRDAPVTRLGVRPGKAM